MAKIIEVENLGKKYNIGGQDKYYKTLRESLIRGIKRPFQKLSDAVSQEECFWALRNVDFSVDEGEVVGIIGRNGAGKSTLLKLLSRITRPNEGYAKLYGRVGSLLEVGTGFHPELTGYENIFLSGNLLGMTRVEVKNKFDEIVDFSGVEKFLDTPVKHFSTGMYVRLGFAIAAHLEPEILLVDEVLAVGDAQFQKKCLGKMNEVAKSGRTVLFVSHNMGAVRSLCNRTIWIDAGKRQYYGDTAQTITSYLSSTVGEETSEVDLSNHPGRLRGMKPYIKSVRLYSATGTPCSTFLQTDTIRITVEYDCAIEPSGVGFNIKTIDGLRVGGFNNYMSSPPPHKLPQTGSFSFEVEGGQFTPNNYSLSVSLGKDRSTLIDNIIDAVTFQITSSDVYGTGYLLTREDGVVALKCKTEVKPI